ncbi:hypothetical protein GOB93_11530 [Acetobacter musti]|uniref:Uncharacterized protein n=1 Tax=Acetobacter musti TaxID=864732 RepID=A0ABX0JPA5_9PROT|nr:hypothetical protein [Acetobacter musti]NHN85268.1 hypothetical protein [Acetobacter musti]
MQKLPPGFDIRKELAGISRVTPQNSSSIPPAIRALLIAPSPVSGQLTALSV